MNQSLVDVPLIPPNCLASISTDFFALGLSKTMLWSDDPSSEIVTGGVCEHFMLPNYRTIVTPDTKL